MKSLLDKIEWRYNPEWSLMEEEEAIWRDDRLSLKAKGIWAYMKSKPGNWDFSAKRIATASSCPGSVSIIICSGITIYLFLI